MTWRGGWRFERPRKEGGKEGRKGGRKEACQHAVALREAKCTCARDSKGLKRGCGWFSTGDLHQL
eukprot:1157183-Pelagomonas_calceolata.AAC.1